MSKCNIRETAELYYLGWTGYELWKRGKDIIQPDQVFDVDVITRYIISKQKLCGKHLRKSKILMYLDSYVNMYEQTREEGKIGLH